MIQRWKRKLNRTKNKALSLEFNIVATVDFEIEKKGCLHEKDELN